MAVKLLGDDVVLATVSFWRGKAWVELFTRSRRRRRTVVVGDEAPVSERGKEMAGKLRKDAVELEMRSVQAGQWWRGGTTVSSSSPAFGWKWQRRSEAWEWRRRRRM
jgi:hypothetical protein